ncbi:carboxymuconolactone decarboxylase family protein, partial [Bacillus mycoides]|nr:carboxymuconolactone decarboxylase family protein [Bacillus mycoides]MED1048751.1 carboxymuconolactone decarboxylase family protein [Bacillus mycoides]MED1050105.1 carboxymuconolactone decarboxylase family protein [Bacillus mycoides]MED1054855.1 carboxymuconolactone decarboxylase family protein [Bacillus mycoides]
MSQRISYYDVAPDGMKIMMDMEKYTKKSTINRITRELIKIRVSQINGCAFCMDMHTSDARKIGE